MACCGCFGSSSITSLLVWACQWQYSSYFYCRSLSRGEDGAGAEVRQSGGQPLSLATHHPNAQAVCSATGHYVYVEALELIVDAGRPARAGRFFQLGADLLALLDELSELPVDWRVGDLRTGSAIVRLAPPRRNPREVRHLRLVVVALETVESGGPLPADWTPDAVKAAHRFVEDGQATEGEEGWVPPRLRLVRDEEPVGTAVDLTPSLLGGLATLQPFERDMPGSVRGELVGVNVSRGNRASLRLPTGRVVRVSFPSGLREAMKDALLQDVELRGTVRQDGEGRAFKVRAEEVEVLGEPTVRWEDLFGAAPGYTGGMPVEEWLEAHRGEA